MKVNAWISPAKLLNIEEKSNYDGSIKWFEGVVMVGTDVNTITVDKNIANDLEPGKTYDFELQITENLKTTKSGQVFRTHKFKITDFEERE